VIVVVVVVVVVVAAVVVDLWLAVHYYQPQMCLLMKLVSAPDITGLDDVLDDVIMGRAGTPRAAVDPTPTPTPLDLTPPAPELEYRLTDVACC
jgi:hypothetical protein